MGMERQERRREVITQAFKVLDSDKDQVLRKYLGITPTQREIRSRAQEGFEARVLWENPERVRVRLDQRTRRHI